MARILTRLSSRMWLLAWLMTLTTCVIGLLTYRVAAYYQMHDWAAQMPPKARAELNYLVSTGQRGSDRFYELYDRFGWDALGWDDFPFLGMVIIVSTVVSGGVGMVLARRISRPITAVAQAAARVSAGERSVRVDKGGTTGETGDLVDSFNKMAAEIDAYERERTVLTAGVAHELRTPLTILKGRLHGLEDGVIDPAAGEAQRLLRQVEQLLHIVEDLGTLANADAGELALDLRPVDLGDVVRAAVADVRSVVALRGVRFVEVYSPAPVLGDPVRLTQVFTNILSNAIKHAPEDREIRVTVGTLGREAVASITDEGPGFDLADAQRLFTPFWRAGANKRAGRPGTGMGLALAAKITEAHMGRITAENRQDRTGARFSVWLPLARQP
jgi:signal transduction histidine kinase